VAELTLAFGLGPAASWEALGRGHIHETVVVRCGERRYVLQRLSTAVFPDVATLLDNLVLITDHLRARLEDAGIADVERRVLQPLRATDGTLSHRDEHGEVWRCSPYIEGTVSRERASGPAEAREAARAFGAFALALSDLPEPPAVTLPGFHDFAGRRAALEGAVREDACGRAGEVADDVSATLRLCDRILAEHDLSGLPPRVVHNDCKLNNLLFDTATGEALCVLDLDTVMEGSIVYDFGELVRTASCAAGEDERDLSKVHVDATLLSALWEGYLNGAAELVTGREKAALPLAGARLALENGVRFLADHLSGDVYFRIHRPGHNLDRHRAQRRLAECLLEDASVFRAQLRR
jgi:hypothetical protein